MNKSINRILLLLLMMTAFISLHTGSSEISVFKGLSDILMAKDSVDALLIYEIRLPRTLLAILVGASLALCGAALQGLLRNPLVEPGLLGISQGAALGAALVFYYGFFSGFGLWALSTAGFIGAMMTLVVLIWFAGKAQSSLLILAGLAVSSITGALLAMVLNYAPNPYAMQELVFWLLGSVSNRDMASVYLLSLVFVIGFSLIWSQKNTLAALALGEEVTVSMGYSIYKTSMIVILATALLIGTSVSMTGNIGFVGLMVPHLLRPLIAYKTDRLLLPSALAGGSLVCLADIVVRLLPSGNELKLGVITTFLGVPLFISMVVKERKKWL